MAEAEENALSTEDTSLVLSAVREMARASTVALREDMVGALIRICLEVTRSDRGGIYALGFPAVSALGHLVNLAELTTLRLGGPARTVVEARSESELVEAVRVIDEAGDPLLLVGGGSNLVVDDAGLEGTVVRVLTRGIRLNDLVGAGGDRDRH